ncbi:hypothetical protein EON65_45115, partial [archaeon]
MNEEIVQFFATIEDNDARRKSSASTASLNAQNYEQISIREILDRIKHKTNTKPTGGREARPNEEIEDLQDYALEAPRSSLLHRDEVLPPLFLPTQFEPDLTLHPPNTFIDAEKADAITKSSKESRESVFIDDKSWSQDKKSMVNKFSLVFESNFECGNLAIAESVIRKGSAFGTPEEYDLFLRSDLLPAGNPIPPRYMQWFLFRVTSTKRRSYLFRIHNVTSPDAESLLGFRPLMLSQSEYSEEGRGWQRVVGEVSVSSATRSPLNFPSYYSSSPSAYTVTFTFQSKYVKDTLYFASAVPYTYTHLQNFIYISQKNPLLKPHLRVRQGGRGEGGQRLDVLLITQDNSYIRPDFKLSDLDEEKGASRSGYEEFMKVKVRDLLPPPRRGRRGRRE